MKKLVLLLLSGVCIKIPQYRKKEHLEPYDGFWLNLDPDRLYEIEKDIINQVVLPEGMLTKPRCIFQVNIGFEYICDVEKAREVRKEAIELWKERH